MRSAPQSRLLAAISLISVMVSCESLGLFEQALDLRFQNARKSSRGPREIRLWLDEEKRLFPGPNHAGEKYQGFSDWTWWIILVTSANPLWAGFFVSG